MIKKLIHVLMAVILITPIFPFRVNAKESLIVIDESTLSYKNKTTFELKGIIPEDSESIIVNGKKAKTSARFETNLVFEDGYGNKKTTLILKSKPGYIMESHSFILFSELVMKLWIDNGEWEVNSVKDRLAIPPLIIENRTMVPFRAIAEAFGANVEWIPATKTVGIDFEDTRIEIQIDKKNGKINGEKVELDVAPTVINGSTVVPLRFIAESFGAEVTWNEDNKEINIRKEFEPFLYGKKPYVFGPFYKNFQIGEISLIEGKYYVPISADIPNNHKVYVDGKPVPLKISFSCLGTLNEPPSFTVIEIRLYDSNLDVVETKTVEIENIELIVYRLFVSKPEMDVGGETVELKTPVKIVDEIPMIPISTLSEIFYFDVVYTEDRKTINFEYMGKNFKITEDNRFVETDKSLIRIPILPRIINEEMYLSYTSIPLIFKTNCTFNKGLKIIQIVREIKPE